ncbi:MAG: prolyl oligopeptidase family serine peptidase [Rubricoccaceae bacterium]
MRARLFPCLAVLLLLLPGAPARLAHAQEALSFQTPAPELQRLVDAPLTPAVMLSPDRTLMALMARPALPALEDLAAPELGLGGLRLNPVTNGPSRGGSFTGIVLRATAPGGAERPVTGLPEGALRIRNASWSPDARYLAFTLDRDDRVELWVADAATAAARRVLPDALNDAAPGTPFTWVGGRGALVARVIPAGRGPAPTQGRVPAGPVVQENLGRAAPARTLQNLLASPHDEALFDYYLTSQLVRVDVATGAAMPIGPAAVYTGTAPSPDGRYLLTQARMRPYSYLVGWNRFPNRVEVWDLASGERVRTIAELPLHESIPIAFGSVEAGPRSYMWRADAPATLVWAEAQDGGDIRAPADVRDRLFMLPAPFTGAPVALVDLPLRFAGITWGTDDVALVTETQWQTRLRRTYLVAPGRPGAPPRVLLEGSTEDAYNDPGQPMTDRDAATGYSTLIVESGRGGPFIYLAGTGASPEGDRPFVRRFSLATGQTTELFRSAAPYLERPIGFLDAARRVLLTQRESPTEPPNYFARTLATGALRALTNFAHPYPELAQIHRETIHYTRADGVPLTATLYLPAGYDAQRDGPLPAFVWAYPTEFRSADAAGQRSGSPYQFTRVSFQGAVPYVTRGYAVLDDASFPIVGEGEAEPNDTFVEQLVMNAEAVIAEGVRRGVVDPDRVAVGGHSYGAFMTANLLAHSDLFRAGIARSGAYNRTLTPFGFQREERTYWQDPDLYNRMSPFMNADKIDEPILLIHGQADDNPGTFTLQSERLYGALRGLGRTARLVLLPFESHGYAARESILHMLWEQDRWLETYVKNAPPRQAAAPAPVAPAPVAQPGG